MSFTQSPTSRTHQPSGSRASIETKQDENDSTEFDDSGDESYGDSAVDLGKYDVMKKPGSSTTGAKSSNTPTQLAEFLQQQSPGRKDSTSAESTVSLVEEIRKILQEKEELKTNEIRKIIQEELGQIHTAGPGATQGHAYQTPIITQQNPAPSIRLQPPSGNSTRAPSPRQARPRSYTNETSASGRPDLSPRSNTIPGVQWSNSVPPVSSPTGTGWTASPSSFTGRSPFEISAVDAKWGQLFDEKGAATKRLGQILSGVGQYILDEFIPHRTLLITPDKLASFYSHHKADPEPHPFIDIFRNRSLSQSFYLKLEDLYQSLSCEYYLVPPSPSSPQPIIPSLTLAGWEKWMTLAIRSNPDAESRRFSSIFSTLPINAISLLDGKPERLPKQISRHLFPEKPDPAAQALFSRSLATMRERGEPISARPLSPRSRYKPISNSSSNSAGVPSPPSSLAGDEDYPRRDKDRERRQTVTYESNNSVRRDPPPRSGGSRPPSRSSNATGYHHNHNHNHHQHQHRHSVSGGLSGYPAPFGRSVSDASVYTERDREKSRRESKSRGRDHHITKEGGGGGGSDKREKEKEEKRRRSSSVVSFDRRRYGGGSRRGSTVVIKDERDRDNRRSDSRG
ncbi:hypothetical protein QBC44DRAFT_311515 [Cladorrhinum sp. PSN332]|nr:hypothetical protein QBC44DRAFT_311515 [Cladorrhinum sp. PSN332]